MGLPARVVRPDRIVDEVIGAAGDLRRICGLSGVTIAAAQRCAGVPGRPSLDGDRATTDHASPGRR